MVALLLVWVAAIAGDNEWTSVGPDAGVFSKVQWSQADSNIVWGTSTNVAFRSVDGGATWSVVGTTPNIGWISDFAVDPANDTRIYIANSSSAMHVLEADGNVEAFPYPGENARGQTITASGSRIYVGGQGTGVWVSTDGGQNWSNMSNGLPINGSYKWVHTIVASPVTPLVAWASVLADGVYVTLDGGENWTKAEGLPLTTYRIAGHPTDANTVTAVTVSGIYKSTDGGLNWAESNDGIIGQTVSAAYAAVDGTTIYTVTREGGIFKTDEGGENWSSVGGDVGSEGMVHVSADPVTGSVIASGWEGAYRSTDSGLIWTPVVGVKSVEVAAFTQSGAEPGVQYLSNDKAGVFITTDNGETWSLQRDGLSRIGNGPGYSTHELASDQSGDAVFVGSVGIYAYSSAAQDWEELPGTTGRNIRALAVNPQDASHIVAAFDAGGLRGLMVTKNGGSHWSTPLALADKWITAIAFDPTDTDNVYVGLQGSAIWKSDDGGASWGEIVPDAGSGEVASIVVDPSDSAVVYAGFSGSINVILKSTDGGDTWEDARQGIGVNGLTALAIDQDKPYVLLAALNTAGVFRSVDAGASWQAMNDGVIHQHPQATMVAFDKANASRVFASLEGLGLASYTVMPDAKVELPVLGNLDAETSVSFAIMVGVDSVQGASEAVLVVEFAEGLDVVAADARCVIEENTAICELGGVNVFGDTVTFNLIAEKGGEYKISAELTAAEEDSNPDNNVATRTYSFSDVSDDDDSGGDNNSSGSSSSSGGCSLSGAGGAGGLQFLLLLALGGLTWRRVREFSQR
jgi:photosystem II stability/assembly factor-like uncharacterized protein